jgi:hypothetical protein
MLEGISINTYAKSDTGAELYLAPIKCGAWLGVRDSAWNMSWFESDCFSILENRFATNAANLSAYTDQRQVPECRVSGLTECVVNVACPFKCKTLLVFSQVMYTAFNVNNCDWFIGRDIVVIVHLVLSFIVAFCLLATDDELSSYHILLRFLACVGCSFFWEFAYAAFVLFIIGS